MRLTRRRFLAAAGGALTAGAAAWPRPVLASPRGSVVDLHTHLFGVGDGNTGCAISPVQKRHWNYRMFLKLLDLEEGRMDEQYVERLLQHVRGSSVDKVVLQAWDGRVDEQGRLDLERTTSIYVPNDYMFRIVRRMPDRLVPCASINPRRRDALSELERCVAFGARIVKVHPPTMDVDPADPRLLPFFRSCANQRVIVMVHTGTEHSADIVGAEVCQPDRLVPALEAGCTVIAAHAGTGAFFDREDYYPQFTNLVRRYPNRWCDTAVLASMFRWRSLQRLLSDHEVMARVLHGSDYPFPSNAFVFWNRLAPWTTLRLATEGNLLERDYRLKLALGVPADVFTRGAALLADAAGSASRTGAS